MIEILHYILDVLWTLAKIAGLACVILFFAAVGSELLDEVLGRKNG